MRGIKWLNGNAHACRLTNGMSLESGDAAILRHFRCKYMRSANWMQFIKISDTRQNATSCQISNETAKELEQIKTQR